MQELIHISQDNEKFVVSARELYSKLSEDVYHYAQWSRTNITGNRFAIKDVDYQLLLKITKGRGRPATNDFMLTMDFAKRISLLSKTKKGAICRDYFIAIEKKAIELSEVKSVADRSPELLDRIINVFDGFLLRLRQLGEPAKPVMLPEPVKNDNFVIPQESISMELASQLLRVYKKGKKKNELMGRNCICAYLKSIGWLRKDRMPFARYSDLFIVKQTIKGKDDNILAIPMTLLKPETLKLLKEKLIADDYTFAEQGQYSNTAHVSRSTQKQKQKELFTTDF